MALCFVANGFVSSGTRVGTRIDCGGMIAPRNTGHGFGANVRRRRASRVATSMVLQTGGTQTASTLESFRKYFEAMSGTWNSERTYYYVVGDKGVERSQMSFDVERLQKAQKSEVLAQNEYSAQSTKLEECEGFQVSFQTQMEKQGLITSFTNLVFVPEKLDDRYISGTYMRDFGYNERLPTVSSFTFDKDENSIVMTTYYTQVVSVDKIRLVENNMRMREIVNYLRPAEGEKLTKPLLIGLGMEFKSQGDRLVPKDMIGKHPS